MPSKEKQWGDNEALCMREEHHEHSVKRGKAETLQRGTGACYVSLSAGRYRRWSISICINGH